MKKDLYFSKSKIDGRGVFTKQPFTKGQTIFILKGDRHVKKNITKKDVFDNPNWVGIDKDTWVDPRGFFQYINHSCDPNMGIRGKVTFVALKKITKGEELTFDYSLTEVDPLWCLKDSCRCGSRKCRRKIKSIQYLPTTVYQSYLPFVPKFFQRVYNKKISKNG